MMVTYEYQCESCGRKFEFRQSITEELIEKCPECQGKLNLLVSGGSGFMIKGGGREWQGRGGNGCSLESSGKTCCGREERCAKPPCEN
jgi:putative FmdB family regulatory protein